jgi:hypothetical protein
LLPSPDFEQIALFDATNFWSDSSQQYQTDSSEATTNGMTAKTPCKVSALTWSLILVSLPQRVSDGQAPQGSAPNSALLQWD